MAYISQTYLLNIFKLSVVKLHLLKQKISYAWSMIRHLSLEKLFPNEYALLLGEMNRQRDGLELIPSENYTSQAVIEACWSHFTNKYSEWYPYKRYYWGQQYTDKVEEEAISMAKKLFNAEHANVQPLTWAIMNIASYFALLEPWDTILWMDLSHGGHLTHWHPVTHMFKVFNFVRYKTDQSHDGVIDYENLRQMALEHKPKLILAWFSAYPRNIDWKKFKAIADEVWALTMADVAHIGWLIAGKALENPLDYGFDVMTLTTHKSLRWPRWGLILCKEKFKAAIDKSIFPGLQWWPIMNLVFAKLICFKEADTEEFRQYSRQILLNAKALCNKLQSLGYYPIDWWTENHLIMLDVTKNWLTWSIAERILDEAWMTLNKNMIPDDPRKPMDPSWIRFGTPAITTRWMKESEMVKIAIWMDRVLKDPQSSTLREQVKGEIREMCMSFPVPGL